MIKKTYKKVENNKGIEFMVILMGGDGGLMRALNDLGSMLKIARITFIALPFGTGNDLARTTNWGPHAS